jgi:hypothetical protein
MLESNSPDEKLKLLRRLDRFRPWHTTADRRLCLGCGRLISGWQIGVGRSLHGLGVLCLRCPTEDCRSGPVDWVEPDGRQGTTESPIYLRLGCG